MAGCLVEFREVREVRCSELQRTFARTFARGVSKKIQGKGQPQSRPNPKKLLLKARGCESLQDAHSKNKNQLEPTLAT
jgi:hypothetical protein